MKTREEAVKLIEDQIEDRKCSRGKGAVHYGKQELRELMDFIYGGEPENDDQKIKTETGWVQG